MVHIQLFEVNRVVYLGSCATQYLEQGNCNSMRNRELPDLNRL